MTQQNDVMLSLSDFKYYQGGIIDWIKYAGGLSRPPQPGGEAPPPAPAALISPELPTTAHGPVSDPALDGGAAAV
ncbi:hypothetical protein [Hymenobacter sp.]|uniref:hypothetical protein n=1 Tax=Hymenobacter sp. TaxID=1898978 RepID=UPI00286D26A1|nr:hypothetical protein [Hymenobacter sp.]